LSDSSAFSLDLSFDRLLDSRASDSDKSNLIDRALNLGSVLLVAAKRSTRKRASMHNALVWPLASDLTIKGNMGLVFTNGDLKEVRDKVYRPFRLPAILVGDGRLGGISGTISAYESLKLRGYDVVAVVF
ncbi:hypothetical protein ACH5RR_037508, partial [Cinchona calisaya]